MKEEELGCEPFETLEDFNFLESKTIENLSSTHKKLLKKFKVAVVFENGALFKSYESTPLTDEDGFDELDMLYGLSGKFTLDEQNQKNNRQGIADSYLIIGDAPGGDKICLCLETNNIYYWHHESPLSNNMFKICDDFDQFWNRLHPSGAENSKIKGIIESESWLSESLSKIFLQNGEKI